MITYEYNINDFKKGFNYNEFEKQLKNNPIYSKFKQISLSGNNILIFFTEYINKTVLDELVEKHEDSGMPTLDLQLHLTINRKVNTTIYKNIGKMVFSTGNYAKFQIISNMENSLTSYTIRLFDKTNCKTLIEGTFTNTTEQINELGPIAISPDKFILEVHAKKLGGTDDDSCIIKDVFVEYS